MRNKRDFPFDTISLFCTLGLIAAVFLVAVLAGAQNVAIKMKPIVYTHPDDGQEMYVAYCAPCHGMTGKGNGPAAPAFNNPPTNLTLLAKHNGDKYPWADVKSTLRFGTRVPAHGDVKMPVWGDLFGSLGSQGRDSSSSKLRIDNLTEYIKTLQAK